MDVCGDDGGPSEAEIWGDGPDQPMQAKRRTLSRTGKLCMYFIVVSTVGLWEGVYPAVEWDADPGDVLL